tara:strand:- start:191 stop:670 length:480 start_codon:yes stop_codon:yes gene_type:complete
MADIILRKAKNTDASEIAAVLLDFYNMNDAAEAVHSFESEKNKDYHYIVALENEKIIGLITWLIHGLPKHGLFELDRICLLSESRGKGVGKKLVDALINDARSWFEDRGSRIRKLYLLTHEDNTSAHIFYEKVGFTHETTLTGHYYDDKDERVYSIFFQ